MVVGKPVLRMTAFQVPEGVFTMVAMGFERGSETDTVPKLLPDQRNSTHPAQTESINY